MTGWIITPEGVITPVSDKLHEGDSFRALYEALGCSLVERYPTKHGELWMDEEGMYKPDAQINPIASAMVAGGIVGTVYLRLRKGFTLKPDGSVIKESTGVVQANPEPLPPSPVPGECPLCPSSRAQLDTYGFVLCVCGNSFTREGKSSAG